MLPSMPGACGVATGFDPQVFTLFSGWSEASSPERQAIARGEAIFNTRQFAITNVPGLNGKARDPLQAPLTTGHVHGVP